jgi:hypothetical protein
VEILERGTRRRLRDAKRIAYAKRLAFGAGDRMWFDVQRLQMGANLRNIVRRLHLPPDAPQPDGIRLVQHHVVVSFAAAEQMFAAQRLSRRHQTDELAIEVGGALNVGNVQRHIAQAPISKVLRHAASLENDADLALRVDVVRIDERRLVADLDRAGVHAQFVPVVPKVVSVTPRLLRYVTKFDVAMNESSAPPRMRTFETMRRQRECGNSTCAFFLPRRLNAFSQPVVVVGHVEKRRRRIDIVVGTRGGTR